MATIVLDFMITVGFSRYLYLFDFYVRNRLSIFDGSIRCNSLCEIIYNLMKYIDGFIFICYHWKTIR